MLWTTHSLPGLSPLLAFGASELPDWDDSITLLPRSNHQSRARSLLFVLDSPFPPCWSSQGMFHTLSLYISDFCLPTLLSSLHA